MYWNYCDPYTMMIQQRQPQTPSPQRPTSARNYSEDFMEKNIGQKITVYLTYDQNKEWNALTFTGKLLRVGRDYFVLRDQRTGRDMMFLNINLNYVVFNEAPARLSKSD
ncbi:spore germination protein Q [Seinonella peptonophila]|uniref:Spore germination protein Q n=1 Tax=Seinonella peptonophila TaxID=112248 RepID=A0A1M4VPW7_9BACL|nr:spore coat protein GerQ [Seinonella peptonophila]SHE70915.1 spore germination protein Q [Seinonella peptonophila]